MSSNASVSAVGVELKNLMENASCDTADRRSTAQLGVDTTDAQHGIETSPLVLIDDEPIGGVEDVRRWLARNAH